MIQTDDTAKRVFAQCYRVFPLTFQKSLIFAVVGVKPQRQFKAAITADHFFLTVRQLGASEKKPLASSLFFIVGHAPDGHAAESLLHLWVCGGKFGIRFHASNIGGGFLNVSRELCEQLIFQTELLALMVGFQHLEFCDLNIQIHLFLDERISCAQCLDFCIGKSLFVHIIAGTHRGFGGHDLADKSLFILKGLEQVRIKRTLRDIVINPDLLILVALPDNASIALGHVAGLPANIQVMHRHKPRLHVRSCPHFCRASEQNPHIAGAHFGE